MRLKEITIKDFKGIKGEICFTPDGKNCCLLARNGTGKTTVADASCWLLSDSDTYDRSQFSIKPLTPAGEQVEGASPSVTGIYILDDGSELTLAKTLKETRSKDKKQLTGHAAHYRVDGEKKSKTAYYETISQFIRKDLIKALSRADYFCDKMGWQDRRKLLMEMAPPCDLEQICRGNPDLSPLPEIIGKKNPESHKNIIAERKKEIDKELTQLSARIKENQLIVDGGMNGDPEKMEKGISDLDKQIDDLRFKLANFGAASEKGQLLKKIYDLELKMSEIRNLHLEATDKAVTAQREAVDGKLDKVAQLERQVASFGGECERVANLIGAKQTEIEDLRQEFYQVDKQLPMEVENPEQCPLCEADISEEKRELIHRKALKDFNEAKALRLEAISSEGKALKGEVENLKAELAEKEKRKARIANDLEATKETLKEFKAELERLKGSRESYKEDTDYLQVEGQVRQLKDRIDKLATEGGSEEEARIQEQLEGLQALRKEKQDSLDSIKDVARATRRISELKKKETALSGEVEKIEHELDLIIQYNREKIKIVEDEVNRRFSKVSFKLFKEQINAPPKECCEVMLGGVPFQDLNNAGKKEAGLDVVKGLSTFFGQQLPVFVDECNSFGKAMDVAEEMPFHVILLYASPGDVDLRLSNKPDIRLLDEEGNATPIAEAA